MARLGALRIQIQFLESSATNIYEPKFKKEFDNLEKCACFLTVDKFEFSCLNESFWLAQVGKNFLHEEVHDFAIFFTNEIARIEQLF